jgi:hypothetical protein
MKLAQKLILILSLFGFFSILMYSFKLEDKISNLEEINIELFYEIQESRIKENFVVSEHDNTLLVYGNFNKKLLFEINSDSTQILITKIY